MKNWMKTAAFAATLACAPAFAADSGFYFGVMGGQADYSLERPGPIALATPVPASGFLPAPVPSFSFRDSFFTSSVAAISVIAPSATWLTMEENHDETAWGVTVGYRIMRYAAVELNYLDLGELEESVPIYGYPFAPTYEITQQMRTSGPALSALGILPVGAGFSLYARVGVIFAEMDVKTSIGTYSDDTSFSSQTALWGAGAQFDWGGHWSLRLDFQRFESVGEQFEPVEADIDLLTFGVLYRL